MAGSGETVFTGASWTTDAPFRETPSAIATASAAGVHAVEMEAASLYAYTAARRTEVVCVAHVTNTMATAGEDFDKGDHDGTNRILSLAAQIAAALRQTQDRSAARLTSGPATHAIGRTADIVHCPAEVGHEKRSATAFGSRGASIPLRALS